MGKMRRTCVSESDWMYSGYRTEALVFSHQTASLNRTISKHIVWNKLGLCNLLILQEAYEYSKIAGEFSEIFVGRKTV
jgi:hypothetical protein